MSGLGVGREAGRVIQRLFISLALEACGRREDPIPSHTHISQTLRHGLGRGGRRVGRELAGEAGGHSVSGAPVPGFGHQVDAAATGSDAGASRARETGSILFPSQ